MTLTPDEQAALRAKSRGAIGTRGYDYEAIARAYLEPGATMASVAELFGCALSTVFRAVQKAREEAE